MFIRHCTATWFTKKKETDHILRAKNVGETGRCLVFTLEIRQSRLSPRSQRQTRIIINKRTKAPILNFKSSVVLIQQDSPRSLQKSQSVGSGGGSSSGRTTTVNGTPSPIGPGAVPEPPSPPGNKSRAEQKKEAQDAINSILPPKEWNEDGQTWRQLVPYTTIYSELSLS